MGIVLLIKHEGFGLEPSTHEKAGMAACFCNSSPSQVEDPWSWLASLTLFSESQVQGRDTTLEKSSVLCFNIIRMLINEARTPQQHVFQIPSGGQQYSFS